MPDQRESLLTPSSLRDRARQPWFSANTNAQGNQGKDAFLPQLEQENGKLCTLVSSPNAFLYFHLNCQTG